MMSFNDLLISVAIIDLIVIIAAVALGRHANKQIL